MSDKASQAGPADAPHEWCRRCGGPNVPWSAASPLWNHVMRGGDINGEAIFDDMVCMTCFVSLATEAGLPPTGWRLTLHPEPEGLTYATPSGRVWNADTFLWEDHCDGCPFRGCDGCKYQGGTDPAERANQPVLWENTGSSRADETAPAGVLVTLQPGPDHGSTPEATRRNRG